MRDDIVLRNIVSLKDTLNYHDNTAEINDLYRDYNFLIRNPKYKFLADVEKVPKEEIEANRKVGTILKYKGNLRISWSFDIEYNKNIDVIFFPEDNPYINYAVLFAKDFPKTISKDTFIDRRLSAISIPYDINYDFVKKVLSQSALSKLQQEKFFEVRFGSVFVPMEIEFEWYSLHIDDEDIYTEAYHKDTIRSLLKIAPDINEILFLLGIIKSYQVLSINTPLNFPAFIDVWGRKTFYSQIFTPFPTAALAFTQTNIGDYLVNVRDKPDTKEGKIVAQLLTQETKLPSDFCLRYDGDYGCDKVNPLYQEIVYQGLKWYRESYDNSPRYNEEGFLYYNDKTKQAYYEKEKSKLINPLDKYLILVWNIEPNNWAKVWVLKMIRDEDWIMVDRYDSNEKEKKYFRDEKKYRFDDNLIAFINGSYSQTFLESPSTLKLHEGYIHCSGLEYFTPFTQNYIKR